MVRNSVFRAFWSGALMMLGACGGGSGGGSDSAPGPTPPGPVSNDLRIDADNVHDVAIVGIGMPESLFQIVLSSVNRTVAMLVSGLAQTQMTQSCGAGQAVVSLTDRDGSTRLSAGDRVSVSYQDDCADEALNDLVTGRIGLEITRAYVVKGADLELEGRLEIEQPLRISELERQPGQTGPSYVFEVSGGFRFRVTAGSFSRAERIEISANSGENVRIVLRQPRSITEQLRDFSVIRRIEPVPGSGVSRLSLEFTHTVESGLLGGRVTCGTTAPLSANFAGWPDAGAYECTGRNGSRVRVLGVRRGGVPDVLVQVDSGGGTLTDAGSVPGGEGNWHDYVEGPVFFLPTSILQDFADGDDLPRLTGQSRSILVNDAILNATNDRIYVSNATGISILDARTLETLATVAVPGVPDALSLTDDGSRLWFALRNLTEIRSMLTATRVLEEPIPLGAPAPGAFATERIAADIAAVPGATDAVVVAMIGGEELVAYTGGAQMPDAVLDTPRSFHRIAFRDAASVVVAAEGGVGTVHQVALRPETGLTRVRSIVGLASDNNQLVRGSEHFITDAGRIFDERDAAVIASLASSDRGPTAIVGADIASGTLYAATEAADRTLSIFQEDPLTLRGTYAYERPEGTSRGMLVTPNDLILVASTGLLRIARASLVGYLPEEPCAREDLGGLLVAGTYVELRCPFNDAVYDPLRNLIYATTPPRAGPGGNAFAIIDPENGTVEQRIAIGTEPTHVTLSPDGTRAYVATPQASSVAVIDLESRTVAARLPLGFDFEQPGQLYYPLSAQLTAVSPLDSNDIIALANGAFRLYRSGISAPNTASAGSASSGLFIRPDGLLAVAIGMGGTLPMELTADGPIDLFQPEPLLPGPYAGQRGDLLFSGDGPVLDLFTLVARPGCLVGRARVSGARVAPDPIGERVYYAMVRRTSTVELDVCDAAVDAHVGSSAVPAHRSGFGQLKALTIGGAGRLAVVFSDRMLIVDRPDG